MTFDDTNVAFDMNINAFLNLNKTFSPNTV